MFVFPTLQMNVINYREDENLFQDILEELGPSEKCRLRLASGYLNLQKGYLKNMFASLKNNSALKVDLLTAAPKANGFYRAGRVKGKIPGVYRVNEE